MKGHFMVFLFIKDSAEFLLAEDRKALNSPLPLLLQNIFRKKEG